MDVENLNAGQEFDSLPGDLCDFHQKIFSGRAQDTPVMSPYDERQMSYALKLKGSATRIPLCHSILTSITLCGRNS
jgi:hypothetical protein